MSTTPPIYAEPINSFDFGGHDIKCFNKIDDYKTKCRDLCTKDDTCGGYVTVDNEKKCCYKKIAALGGDGSKRAKELNFYVKNSILKDYIKSEKKVINGSDIKYLAHMSNNIPALKATCSARDNCKG